MLIGAIPALAWLGVLLAPWQPWRTRERLDAPQVEGRADLSDVTVVIPARDEANVLPETLAALAEQGAGLRTIVVDDQSRDGTAAVARSFGRLALTVIDGRTMPAGWTGKLWALEQARCRVATPLTLLLDADIVLRPGVLSSLRAKLRGERLDLVSLMARLRMRSAWERLLLPAFVYFFKLIYPFSLSNRGIGPMPAAAGGCVLIRTAMLDAIGGFGALRGALIDDCALARCAQRAGGRTWIGLTHDAVSTRPYDSVAAVWRMVRRTAYTQLGYSPAWLAICTLAFVVAFGFPWLALAAPLPAAQALGVVALIVSAVSYLPTLRYYRLSPLWVSALPLIAALYLAMTWDSAWRHWGGLRSEWRGRIYASDGESSAATANSDPTD